jgi:cytochrome c-type biogenesis protein CcmH/NrfG
MARVSLRVYTREIESLIDQGATNEAIAHCRHILKTFPKHLETYRLLGKSYLESHRYGEAVDVFSRVLMSVPDDFVAHVGMSIINDEQNKLDDSIWHMERAFEAQPSNAAIQGELQRLYGRRDGMEPPKVRMTRGALAHMYVQGELYPQAIAEIRAVLGQDPQRADMQVLLARAYFKSGQKTDAAQSCTQLLKSYPYCFDANRIMVELTPSSVGAPENTQVYRTRVGELDPYAAVSKGSVLQTNEVPDTAINVERLEYTGDEVPMGQEWSSSLGIGLSGSSNPALAATSSASQPDWLKSFSSSDQGASSDPFAAVPDASTSQSENEIPDFLRTAGWGESSGPEQPASFFDSPEPANGGALAPADIPDWLQGQVPSEPALSFDPPQIVPTPESTFETPDWLAGLGGGQFSEAPAAAQPPSTETPDWLGGLGGVQSAQPEAPASSSETPDWLGGPGGEQSPPVNTFQNVEPMPSSDTPDWLGGLGGTQPMESAPAEASDTPDWLSGLGGGQFSEPAQSEDVPNWLGGLGSEQPMQTPAASIENLGSSAQEQDDAVAWLESLAAKHGAKPEELVTDPSKRSDIAPDWVQQASAAGESQPIQPTAQWSENAQNIGEQFFNEFEDAVEPVSPLPTDETGMWLKAQEEKEKLEQGSDITGDIPGWMTDAKESTSPGYEAPAQRTDLPDWLGNVADEPTTEGLAPRVEHLSRGDLSDWLSGLDDEPAVPTVAPSARGELPEWLSTADSQNEKDADDWDKQAPGQENIPAAASMQTEEPASASMASDLPGWLQGVDEESGQENVDEPRESWEEEPRLKPTSPSDWHPVEEKPELAPRMADLGSRPPKPAPKPSAAAPSQEPVYEPIEKESDWAPEEQPVVESRKPIGVPPVSRPVAQPVMQKPPSVQAQPVPPKPASPKKSGARTSETVPGPSALTQAKDELDRGDIPTALEHYGKLIKKGRHLEETIRDLSESIYRYPVEVGIWQTLGDAYMRANRLKEALEAYNKAEELIR